MKRAGVRVGTGTRFAYDGEVVTVVELHLVDGVLDLADRSGGHGTKALRADCIGGGVGSHTVSLSVLGTPVKVDPLFVCGVWPGPRAVASLRGTAVGVEVERPQCSEDERPRGRRGSAADSVGQDETKEVMVQVICGPPVRERGAGERCACRRPALSGSTDQGPAT